MFGKLTYLGVFWVFFKHNTACSLWCSWILNVRKGSKPVHFFPLFYACSVMFRTKVCVYMRMVVLLNLENISHRFLAMLHLALWAALLLSRQQCSVTQSFWKMFQRENRHGKDIPMDCKLFQILVFNLENFEGNTFSENSLKPLKSSSDWVCCDQIF